MGTFYEGIRGYFTIARESSDISFELFCQKYYDTEQPVIIENIAYNWPARKQWDKNTLYEKLLKEPSADTASLWYRMARNALNDDYETPEIVDKCLDSPDIFMRPKNMRIWVHEKGNISNWHYDSVMTNVFNVQVTGQKEWFLISPVTPLDCYPFSNFAILDGKEERIFKNKIHTSFILNEGDMLYLPPLWFHKVISCQEENISLNWVLTKKETNVNSKALTREIERYLIYEYFTKHRFKILQRVFNKINAVLPGHLGMRWIYNDMIKSFYREKRFNLLIRMFKEWGMLGKALLHVNNVQPYMKAVKAIKKLNRDN